TESGYDADLWRQLAEMGITGLIIDPEFGGAGAGPLELEAVMEEAGAALLCGPLLSSAVFAAGLLDASGDADAKARLLPGIASGECIATVAVTGGERASWTAEDVAVTANGDKLSGVSDYVMHANLANVMLVVAKTRSEEHTSELHHVKISYAVFCLKKKNTEKQEIRRKTYQTV